MQDKRSIADQQGDFDVITPADFTPPPPPGKRFGWRPRWYHGLILAMLGLSVGAAWFVLTARSVFIDVTPADADIGVSGGLAVRVGPRYLMQPGSYDIRLRAHGYVDSEQTLQVGEDRAQTHPVAMTPEDGRVSISVHGADSTPMMGARIQLDGVDLGSAPIQDLTVPPGIYDLQVQAERYLPYRTELEVAGRLVEQELQIEMEPAWATVSFATAPDGADVIVNGELLAVTPAQLELVQGAYEVTLKRAGFKAWQDDLQVQAGQHQQLPPVELEPADGLVFIRSVPGNANITINGEYRGQTPLELQLPPGQDHELRLFRTGFETATRRIRTVAEQESDITVALNPITNLVRVIADPPDAELYVDGEFKGAANQSIELMAASQRIEIRRDGYVAYATNFTSRPGLDQEIRVRLKSEEEARLEAIQPEITTVAGQTLTLFYPHAYTMGSSRREPGRRANETLRDVVLEKAFYLSETLVTNDQFKRFRPEHASGTLQGRSLDLPRQPVVQVSWLDAALYTNWLSEQESLTPFYLVEDDEVVGFNPDANGYRLPTEAEWEWAARSDGQGVLSRFPWGDTWPPPEGVGNFADDSTSAFLGQYLRGYSDGHPGSSNVKEFPPNALGLYDMAGNVSEWVHDIYGAVSGLSSVREVDPLGPEEGRYHTIKGSAWSHGTITELRSSFRDFGDEARNDVGFRIARYLGD